MFASYSYILNAIDPSDIMNAVIDIRMPQLRARIFSVIQKKQKWEMPSVQNKYNIIG